jgi:hypothetical protein
LFGSLETNVERLPRLVRCHTARDPSHPSLSTGNSDTWPGRHLAGGHRTVGGHCHGRRWIMMVETPAGAAEGPLLTAITAPRARATRRCKRSWSGRPRGALRAVTRICTAGSNLCTRSLQPASLVRTRHEGPLGTRAALSRALARRLDRKDRERCLRARDRRA